MTVPTNIWDDAPVDAEEQARLDHLLRNVRSGSWLDAQVFPPLSYAIPAVIPEGFTVLSGAPKAGKSWLMLDLCLAVASGGHAIGSLPTTAGSVFYLALEDGDRRLQDRIRQLRPLEPIPQRFNYVTTAEPGSVLRTIDAWMTRQPDTRLIALDTLGRVMPPALSGETTYSRDYRVGSAIKAITAEHPGLAIVVVHHTRKAGSDDFVEASSGTFGVVGAADTVAVLQRDRLAENAVLSITGRDVLEAEYGLLRASNGSWDLAGGTLDAARAAAGEIRQAAQLDRQGDRTRDAVSFVNGREATKPRELAEHLSIDAKAAGGLLARAAERGLIDKAGYGTYVPNAVARADRLGFRVLEGGAEPAEVQKSDDPDQLHFRTSTTSAPPWDPEEES